jgi:hypothetical protein
MCTTAQRAHSACRPAWITPEARGAAAGHALSRLLGLRLLLLLVFFPHPAAACIAMSGPTAISAAAVLQQQALLTPDRTFQRTARWWDGLLGTFASCCCMHHKLLLWLLGAGMLGGVPAHTEGLARCRDVETVDCDVNEDQPAARRSEALAQQCWGIKLVRFV